MAKPASILRARLTRAHLALARGWVQGLELRTLVDRYLAGIKGEDAADLRVARARLQHTLDELTAVARRAGLQGAATLARQAVLIREPEGVPSLEEFAQRFDADFHSQDELLALYQAEHGQAPGAQATQRAARRRARLMQRQLQLITELENLAVEDLTPASPLAAWFAPVIAERLHQADLFTVAQLVERIASVPRRWWSGIPGIGDSKGQRIRRFLEAHLGPIHVATPTHALASSSAAATAGMGAGDVVPLERLQVPQELSGERGSFRAPQECCAIAARHDYGAVLTWLDTKASALTQAAYRIEGERLLLWCVLERRKGLSSMTAEDCSAYMAFLANLPAAWISRRRAARWQPGWSRLQASCRCVAASTRSTSPTVSSSGWSRPATWP